MITSLWLRSERSRIALLAHENGYEVAMKLPTLTKSSTLGSGPDLGLGHKGETIEARPMHQLERKIAPKVLGGTVHSPGGLHGSHIKGLSQKGPGASSGATPPIPTGF